MTDWSIVFSLLAMVISFWSVRQSRLGLYASVFSYILRHGETETFRVLVEELKLKPSRASKYIEGAKRQYGYR